MASHRGEYELNTKVDLAKYLGWYMPATPPCPHAKKQIFLSHHMQSCPDAPICARFYKYQIKNAGKANYGEHTPRTYMA